MLRIPEERPPWTDSCVGNIVFAESDGNFRATWDWLTTHGYKFVRCTNVNFVGVVCWAERTEVQADNSSLPGRIGLNAAWRWYPLHPDHALFLWLLCFIGGVTASEAEMTAEGLHRIRIFVERYTTLQEERVRTLQLLDELMTVTTAA